jgi:cell division protein FtsZ
MLFLEEHNINVSAREVKGDARSHAAAADHDYVCVTWHLRRRQRLPNWLRPYRAFLYGIFIHIHAYIKFACDNPLSPRSSDVRVVPEPWQLGLGDERARVAIVGCGGAGCNILRHVAAPANGIRIALNDAVHPSMSEVSSRVLIPAASLQAYASMDEKAVQKMETTEEKEISAALLDRDFILILGGLGGELGGWGMSLVGRVARILGDASLAFATVPFTIEGPIRRQLAEAQLQLLQKRVDGVVTFANDRLLQVARDLPLAKAFAALGAIMARPAANFSAVLGRADVAPLRRMLKQVREWRFGMGAGREKHRCFLAVEEAYASPWFTSLPEELSHAIVLISSPQADAEAPEILREIHMRSPKALLAWASLPSPPGDDRVVVQLLGGV